MSGERLRIARHWRKTLGSENTDRRTRRKRVVSNIAHDFCGRAPAPNPGEAAKELDQVEPTDPPRQLIEARGNGDRLAYTEDRFEY
jgi:hypothetical protein